MIVLSVIRFFYKLLTRPESIPTTAPSVTPSSQNDSKSDTTESTLRGLRFFMSVSHQNQSGYIIESYSKAIAQRIFFARYDLINIGFVFVPIEKKKLLVIDAIGDKDGIEQIKKYFSKFIMPDVIVKPQLSKIKSDYRCKKRYTI
jgi:hypothetical protein